MGVELAWNEGMDLELGTRLGEIGLSALNLKWRKGRTGRTGGRRRIGRTALS
jgi:hypothetical protein